MKRRNPFNVFSRIMGPILIAIVAPAWADPATQPATQPTVASVLAGMDTAYASLQSAQFDGRIIGHFDAAGMKKNEDVSFTSTFAAPNQFRHEIPGQILLGSTGTNVYSFLNSREEYQTTDAPKTRVASGDWPASITGILVDQNPSLLLAMSKSAADELNQLSSNVTLEPATTIDDTACDTLRFDVESDHQIITMLVDPTTHLLRQVKFDMRTPLESAGTTDVKVAEVTIDYTRAAIDAPMPANKFAWTAPTGAILTSATNAQADDDPDMSDALKALIGKDAPDFSLQGLDGKSVKLSEQKGSVVLVDFWATWCAPCVAAMPNRIKLYKEQSPNGLKVFAVNYQDDKDTVVKFVNKHQWDLPVLLDPDGTTGQLYKLDSLPETVVIGKDGKIKQIFLGIHHEDDILAAVAKEMK